MIGESFELRRTLVPPARTMADTAAETLQGLQAMVGHLASDAARQASLQGV